jgi:hypothetical protein
MSWLSKEQYAYKHNVSPELYDDVKEISKWVNWFRNDTYKRKDKDVPKWAIVAIILGAIMLCMPGAYQLYSMIEFYLNK